MEVHVAGLPLGSSEHWLSHVDGRLRKPRFAAVLAAWYLLFAVSYLAMNASSEGRVTHTLLLKGEARLPFQPVSEYFYVLTYFVPALLLVTVTDYGSYRRLVRAFCLILVIAYSTYLVFPVYVERPHFEVSSLATWLLSIEYLDKPYNAFPSLHVAFSWLAVFASRVSRPYRAVLSMLAAMISLSTVLVKQHYVVDVLFGCVLAWGAWRVAGRRPTAGVRFRSIDCLNI